MCYRKQYLQTRAAGDIMTRLQTALIEFILEKMVPDCLTESKVGCKETKERTLNVAHSTLMYVKFTKSESRNVTYELSFDSCNDWVLMPCRHGGNNLFS